jgi:WD40 repeat protein
MNLGRVMLWDAATGTAHKELPVDGWNVYAGAFSPDGAIFASGDQDGRVELWDTSTGALMATWTDGSPVSFVAFDPAGALLASGSDNGTVVVRNTKTGRTIATWTDGVAVTGLGFSDRGHAVVTGDEHGRAVLRDTRGLVTSASFGIPVMRLAFTDDSTELVAFTEPASSTSEPNQVTHWDLRNDTTRAVAGSERAAAMSASADGRLLVTVNLASDPTTVRTDVTVSRLRDDAPVSTWTVDGVVDDLAVTADGKLVVTSEGSFSSERTSYTLTVRDSATGKVVRTVPKSQGSLGFASIAQPGPRTAVADDGSIAVIDVRDFGVVRPGTTRVQPERVQGLASSAVAMSADGRTIATVDYPANQAPGTASVVRLHDTETGETVAIDAPELRPTVVAFSPDGRSVAIGDVRRGVTLYDVKRRRVVTTWKIKSAVTSLAFSPDGQQLAAGSASGEVVRWDAGAYVATPERLASQICRTLRGYRPSDSQWQHDVPYSSYADLCK